MLRQIFAYFALSGFFGLLAFFVLKLVTGLVFSKAYSSVRYYPLALCLIICLIPIRIELPCRQQNTMEQTVIIFSDISVKSENMDVSDNEDAPEENAVQHKCDFPILLSCLDRVVDTFCVIYPFFVLFLLISRLACYVSFCVDMRKGAKKANIDLEKYGYGNVAVLVTNKTSTPVLVYMEKPYIFLPDAHMTDVEIHMSLLHELSHHKRYDVVVRIIGLLAECVHFYNPFVYMAVRCTEMECEMNCDMYVSSTLSESQRKSYVSCILSLAGNAAKSSRIAFGLGGSKKELKRRFCMILNNEKTSKSKKVIFSVVAAVTAVCALLASGVLAASVIDDEKHGESLKKANGGEIIAELEAKEEQNSQQPFEESETKMEITDKTEISDKTEVVNKDGPKLVALKIVPPLEEMEISACYSDRHPATDYKAPAGTEIFAGIDGYVTCAEYDHEKGNYVTVTSFEAEIVLTYAHMGKMYVKAGDKVNAGDVIGTVGNTGMATGPHLHFALSVCEKTTNPETLFVRIDDMD